MNLRTLQKKAGFTLLETLVAIAILTVAVGGALSMAQKSLQSAYYSESELTASNLAAEGIELVRNVRDSAVLAGNNWLSGLSLCLNNNCSLDAQQTDAHVQSCNGTCLPLSMTSTGIYTYTSGTPTKIYPNDFDSAAVINRSKSNFYGNLVWRPIFK